MCVCMCMCVFMYYVLCWRVCVYVRIHVQYVQYMHSTCMHMSVWYVHVGGIHMYIHVHVHVHVHIVILKIYVTQLVYMYIVYTFSCSLSKLSFRFFCLSVIFT